MTEMADRDPAKRVALVAELDREFGPGRLEVLDPARGSARFAWFDGATLVAALFIAPETPQVAGAWVAGLMGGAIDGRADRAGVLAGTAPGVQADTGPMVCACFSVGLATIERCIADQRLTTIQEIGAALRAGTGCGSCIPALTRVLHHSHPIATAPQAAE